MRSYAHALTVTHITTSDPDATEVVVKPVWSLYLAGRHVATVYAQSIALDWWADGRADEIVMGRVVRHPQTSEVR